MSITLSLETVEPQLALRWEKSVELELALWVQSVHVEREMRARSSLAKDALTKFQLLESALKIFDDKENPDEMLEALTLAVQTMGDLTETLATTAAKLVREAKFMPLDGNAEKWLGDALVSVDGCRVSVVECKGHLSETAWHQECDLRQDSGKDRTLLLAWIEAHENASLKVAEQCHFIVGRDGTRVAFMPYWNFIAKKDTKCVSLPGLGKKGVSPEEISKYLEILVAGQGDAANGEAELTWLDQEINLLVSTKCELKGIRLSYRNLRNKLKESPKQSLGTLPLGS